MHGENRSSDSLVAPGITATKVLVVLNVVIFVFLSVRGDPQDSAYMLWNGALWTPDVLEEHAYYRLITAVFLHFSLTHLFNNMLLLFFMGDVLEHAVGRSRFLIIYLSAGVGGNMLTVAMELRSGSYSVSAGASGAVFGVLGALLCLLVINRGRVAYLTAGRMVFYVLYSLFAGLTSSGVNNAAHLGGLVIGFVLMFLLSRLILRR